MTAVTSDLGAELEIYRQALRSALDRDLARADADRIEARTHEARNSLAALDAFGLLVAEDAGGSGAGLAPMAVVLEEIGRAGVGGWFLSSAVVAAHLLAGADSATLRDLLGDVAAGRRIAVPALSGPSGRPELASVDVVADRDREGAVLRGVAAFVPAADVADVFLVAARRNDRCVEIHAVGRGDRGLTVGGAPSDGVNGSASLRLDDVAVPANRALAPPLDEGRLAEVVSLGAVAVSAEMVGSAERVLELTVAYAGDREQFGAPIGAFEMVQHHCVQMRTDVQGARAVTARAVRALSTGGADRHRLASTAKAWSAQALRRVTVLGHAVHGAIGFSAEHELPRHTAAALWRWPLWGDPAFHLARVAATL